MQEHEPPGDSRDRTLRPLHPPGPPGRPRRRGPICPVPGDAQTLQPPVPPSAEGDLVAPEGQLAGRLAVQTSSCDGGFSRSPHCTRPADSSSSALQYEEDDLTREMLALAAPRPAADSPLEAG